MVSSISERHLPKLPSRNSLKERNYPPVRNRLAEQDSHSMNQTYTIGSASRQQLCRKERSNSVDSDMAEYSIHGAIAGLLPRSLIQAGSIKREKFSAKGEKKMVVDKNGNREGAISVTRFFSNKLPSLDGLCSDKKCSQRPWNRSQLELQKFKETLKNC